jgi:hypothetical protein
MRLFYELEAWCGGNSLKYRLPSNLNCPSPLGTELFIDCTDVRPYERDFHVAVSRYEHRLEMDGARFGRGEGIKFELDDFYMILSMSGEHGDEIHVKSLEGLGKALERAGWERMKS